MRSCRTNSERRSEAASGRILAINVASRIEDANKTLGARFLMSEALFNQVPQVLRVVRHLPSSWCRSLPCRVLGQVSDNP